MNRYKVTDKAPVLDWAKGDEFEHEFSADEEAFYLDNGFLELLPIRYKNVGGSRLILAGDKVAEPGDEFEAAFPQRQELLLGSHLERVKEKKEK